MKQRGWHGESPVWVAGLVGLVGSAKGDQDGEGEEEQKVECLPHHHTTQQTPEERGLVKHSEM